jgi:hypothetical protein
MHDHYLNMVWATRFPINGTIVKGESETQLFASTKPELINALEARKLNEKVSVLNTFLFKPEVPLLPSELYAKGRLQEALHAACWLGWLACKAGVTTGEELLDDNGVIHNLSHLCLPKKIVEIQEPKYFDKIKKDIPLKLKALEDKTPGFHKWLTEKEFKTAKEELKGLREEELREVTA